MDLLQQIAAQTVSYLQLPGYLNATTSTPSPLSAVASADLAVNACWFASLIFSLATASIAIFSRQLFQGYLVIGTKLTSAEDRVRIRYRRNQQLEFFGLSNVATMLSIPLQISLALFFTGLCLFTFSVHRKIWETSMVLICVWMFLVLLVSTGYYPFRCSWYLPSPPKLLDVGLTPLGPNNDLNIFNIFSKDDKINDLAMFNDLDSRLMHSQLLWHICQVIPRLPFDPPNRRASRKLRFGLLALTRRRIKGANDIQPSHLLQGLDMHSIPATAWHAVSLMFADELSRNLPHVPSKLSPTDDSWAKMFCLMACSIVPEADNPMATNVKSMLYHILRHHRIDDLLSSFGKEIDDVGDDGDVCGIRGVPKTRSQNNQETQNSTRETRSRIRAAGRTRTRDVLEREVNIHESQYSSRRGYLGQIVRTLMVSLFGKLEDPVPPLRRLYSPINEGSASSWPKTSIVLHNISDVLKMMRPSETWHIISHIFQHFHSKDLVTCTDLFAHSDALQSVELLVDLLVALLPVQLQSMEPPIIAEEMMNVLFKAIVAFPDVTCRSGDGTNRESVDVLMESLILPVNALHFFRCLSTRSEVLYTRAGKTLFKPDRITIRGELPLSDYPRTEG